jgi:hypothetical protein
MLTNRAMFNEEIRSRLHYMIQSLREHKPKNSFYNLVINTPEFSRFVFVVPSGFLLGVGILSVAPPGSMPLVFEKVIPYHIKTIAVSTAFYSFADLAMHVIGRPSIFSHHKWHVRYMFLAAYSSLLLATGAIMLADTDAHGGYKACLGLTGLGLIPVMLLTMPGWMRVWRGVFLATSLVSTVTADSRLAFYESNWNSLIFSPDL